MKRQLHEEAAVLEALSFTICDKAMTTCLSSHESYITLSPQHWPVPRPFIR